MTDASDQMDLLEAVLKPRLRPANCVGKCLKMLTYYIYAPLLRHFPPCYQA